MEWFRSKGITSEKKEDESEAQSEVYRSLALNVLYHQFREKRSYRILDLGPPIGQNVEFFSQFSCKLHIEDLYDSLSSFDYFSPEDGFSYDAVYSYLLPFQRNSPFDIILAWDLFNYLNTEEFRHLIVHLSRFSQNGTVLFSLISTTKHIPESPIHFKIIDSENLLYHRRSKVLRSCPQYDQSTLDHIMPNFRTCNSFLLRNGFKEYLFLYE